MQLSEEQLRPLDRPGPSYTSYPSADRFVEAFGAEQVRQMLRQRSHGIGAGASAPLSLSVHLPFCAAVCFCAWNMTAWNTTARNTTACNKKTTQHDPRGLGYLGLLRQEIGLYVAELGTGQAVSQLVLGAGSGISLSDDELAQLMALLHAAFKFNPGAELAIEADPRTTNAQQLARWSGMGFNRISFCIQDFDDKAARAAHRTQALADVQALVDAARALAYGSINVNLAYGLPHQTEVSLARALAQVAALRPTRIALYDHADLPKHLKQPRRSHSADLPSITRRMDLLGAAITALLAQGYVYIGMDLLALPDDPLVVAKRQGRLQRNFQGYSTQSDGDTLGLGVGAIGRMGASYSQNAPSLQAYRDALALGCLPVVRGLALSREDLLRRSVIMGLVCQGRVDFESITLAHLVELPQALARPLAELQALQPSGLVAVTQRDIQVTPLGRFFVRTLASVFDQHLQRDAARERFSSVI